MPSAKELQATNNQILANLSTPQSDSMQQTLANIAQSSTVSQSALGAVDRMRYSFADTWGKQKIIQQAGYNPNDIVQLQNGEYGVRTQQGIKPIDPKGFQMKDLAGDMADMVGKTVTTAGAVAGGLLGGVPGAMAGGAGGELARQKIGDALQVRIPGLQGGDTLEIGGEALLAGAGEGVGRVVASKLAKFGALNAAQNAVSREMTGQYPSTLVGKADKLFNIKNKYLTNDLLAGKLGIVEDADDPLKKGVSAIMDIVSKGRDSANANYRNTLMKEFGENFNDTITFKTEGLKNVLTQQINALKTNDIAQIKTKQIGQLEKILSNIQEKGTITNSQMQTAKSALQDIRMSTFIDGKPTSLTRDIGKVQGAFLELKNTNQVLKQADANYAKELGLYNALEKNAGIRLEAGEITEGFRTPERLMLRLKDEMSERRLARLDKIQGMLNDNGIKTDFMTQIKTGLVSDILNKNSRIPLTGFTGTPIGLAKTAVNKLGVSELNLARMFNGALKMSPDMSAKTVGRHLGMVETLATLASGKTGIPIKGAGQVISGTGKAIGKTVGLVKTPIGQRIASQVVTRKSLNDILYGK